jgi:hypothetical protein
MPIVKVGDERIKFPDGMSREQIQAALQNRHSQTQVQQQQALTNEGIGAGEAFLIGAGRGLTSIGRGLGIADPEDPSVTRSFDGLREQHPIAATGGEIAGQSAPFLLPGAGIGAIASTPARVAAVAGLGATEGGLIARGEGRDVEDQIATAGIGGLAAGTLELALPVIGRIGGKIVRRALGRAPKGSVIDAAGNPSQEFVEALKKTGTTFDDVAEQARLEVAGSVVDPEQAARNAFLRAEGLEPTRAQVTRNAADFQAQQEAAKTSGRVRSALEKQEAILTSRFDNAVLETGGKADLPTSSVVDFVTEKATRLDQDISDLYRAAREAAPSDKSVKFSGLGNKLRTLAPSDRATDGAIGSITGELQSRGIMDGNMKVVGRVGVDIAEEVRKSINQLYDPAKPFRNIKLREVKDALDSDVFKSAGDDIFKKGRQAKAAFESELSRAKISKFDSRKANLVRDILENKINPDTIVDDVVFSKKWRGDDIRQLKSYISTDEAGKQAFDDIRAETLHRIKEMSFIGPEDAQGIRALSRDKLQKAITKVGRDKMNTIFTKDEQKFLKRMLDVSKLREPVRGTALGRGPSAQAVARIEQKMKELPVISSLVDFVNIDASGRIALRASPQRISAPLPPAFGGLAAPIGASAASEDRN